MNTIDRMASESRTVQQFAKDYLRYLATLLQNIDTDAVATFVEELELARKQQNTIFFVGNGGSAATASHMANDFGVGVHKNGDEEPFRVLALTDNVATLTAVGNDYGYENLFVGQLRTHYRKGDKLVAISASGNSPNVVAATEWVKKRGGRVIGLVGFDGGELKEICDIVIHIKTSKGEYGPVEDVHMVLDHVIHSWLLSRVRKEKNK